VAATPTIAAQFPFPTTVIANYPVLDEWEHVESPVVYRTRPPHCAYVGVITTSRGRDEMIAAAALVHDHRIDFRLIFAGIVDPETQIPQGRGVEYAGNLSRPGVVELLTQCRFGVVLFKPLPNHTHSLPTKYFEYLAAGLPVVVSSSLRELVRITQAERCGLVVDYEDLAGIAEAMRSLLDNPEAAYEMGMRGRRTVLERFAWSTEGAKLLDLYAAILRPNKTDSGSRKKRPLSAFRPGR
jgi:glycosyltransferase involved in cell wall biosynthesis